jgi:outer membrane protein OmpA-like peptidoglycan-associated protein
MLIKKTLTTLVLSGAMLNLVGCCNCASWDAVDDAPVVKTSKISAVPIAYFDYNSYGLTENDKILISEQATKLLENPTLIAKISGHADERGSDEFNLKLGELRAIAVREFLALKGVPPQRIMTTSYGKRKPIVVARNEQAYSQNRRVELECTNYVG